MSRGRKSVGDKPLTPAEKMRRYRERLAAQGKKTVTMIVDSSQPDPNQTNLVSNSDPRVESISQLIQQWRNNPKVNLYANMNKNLLAFIQQIEETLE